MRNNKMEWKEFDKGIFLVNVLGIIFNPETKKILIGRRENDPYIKELLSIYYLCEVVGGKEKAGEDFVELKWVKPEEIEKYFTTSFHPKLKEYIMNLK